MATPFGPTLHVDRRAFDALLLRACELRGVAVKRGASLLRLDCGHERAVVELHHAGAVLRTECAAIVDATGRSAWVCRQLQAKRERIDRLFALVAHFERGDTEPSSLVESGPDGWWYSAPRPRGLLVTMYLTELFGPGQRNRELMFSTALDQAPITFRRAAARARTTGVGAHRAGPEWTCFDPELPVLPVGDAALSFDPIAGEGICFARRSGMEAAKALGSVTLRRAYRDGARGIYEQHLREREAAYALERRRRATPFWMRPRGSVVAQREQGFPETQTLESTAPKPR